ncbi:hypothetical protein BGX26_008751, partial [Mortierella sp. AD094]
PCRRCGAGNHKLKQCQSAMIPIARQPYNEKRFGKGNNIVDDRHYCGDMVVCKRCNALMFYSERVKGSDADPKFSLCCKSGAVTNIPTIDPDPVLGILIKPVKPSLDPAWA